MWIPLGARWDQEPAGSLVVPTPQKIAGSVAGEREGKGGEKKGGEIGLRSFLFGFFFFFVELFSITQLKSVISSRTLKFSLSSLVFK